MGRRDGERHRKWQSHENDLGAQSNFAMKGWRDRFMSTQCRYTIKQLDYNTYLVKKSFMSK